MIPENDLILQGEEAISSRPILEASRLPDVDYVINPYIGCRFGCIYCYASKKCSLLLRKKPDEWGKFAYAKSDCLIKLQLEMDLLPIDHFDSKKILLSAETV
jgi:DNA repair photolyase